MQKKIDIMAKQIEALETAQLEAKKRTNKISAPTYAEVAAIDKSNRTKTNQRDKISNIITTSVEAAGEVGTKARLQKIGELLTKGHYPTEIRRPMAKRLLPAASAIENPALADAISKTKAVYITGIQRQRISNIRTLLRLAGKFGAKEVLNISFVGRHITSFLCGSADIANNLKESIQSWPKIKALTDFDPLDERSAELQKALAKTANEAITSDEVKKQYIQHIAKDMFNARNMAAATALQRSVPEIRETNR